MLNDKSGIVEFAKAVLYKTLRKHDKNLLDQTAASGVKRDEERKLIKKHNEVTKCH